MKKFFLFFSLIFTVILAHSQTPQGITFQAVARDPSGNAARLRQINIIDRILVGSGTNGAVAWEEKHVTTTNAEGVFTIIVGKGTKVSGTSATFNDIKWDQGVYFFNLKVSVFPSIPTPSWNPDANYVDMGSSQFWSVPYALYSGNISTGVISIANGGTGSSTQNFVDITTSQSIAGNKTFTGNLIGASFSKSGGTANQFLKADGTVDTVGYAPIFSPTFTGTISGISKSMVGLGNVDNTNDLSKPISSLMQAALNQRENLQNKSANTALGTSDELYPTQSAVKKYVDSVIVVGTPDASATTKGKILLAGDLAGTSDAPTVPSLSLKAPINNPTFTGTVGGITKSMVGLGNVDNTTDALKPISTAAQTALDLKAPLESPTFTGIVGGITKSMVGLGNVDNTTDALKPISTAAQTALDLKAPLASPTFTGTVGGITKSMVGLSNVDNTTDALKPISTEAQTALDLKAPLASPTFTGIVGGITKSMVGLSNVDNTTDALKPISTAAQTALDLKAPLASPTFTGTVGGITKSMVGLGNVDNTTDALKPISTAAQTALDLKEALSNKSININTDGTSDLKYPSVKSVKTYVDLAVSSGISGVPDATSLIKGKIKIAGDLGGTADLPTVPGLSLKAPVNNPTFTGTVGGVTKSMVGLGNVDNTSDAAKSISTAAQTALDLKAPLASPTFTGTVGGITKSMVGLGNVDNTTDALKPISTAAQTALDLKAPLASPNFTGTVGGITKSMVGLGNVENTTDALKPISTAAQTALDLKAPLASPTFTGTVGGITKSMVGLGNVDNSSDALKPISTATQTALDLKEVLTNKSININADGASDVLYPSVKSVKTYVDVAVASGVSGVPDATSLIKGKIKIAGDLGGTSDLPTVPQLSSKVNYSDTALMLSNRIARDTASLSLRINDKLNYSDTALMLSNRIARDTASLSLRINEKMGYADTALMLSNRIARDTASLSLRINDKINYSDTALMLSNRIARDTASLSSRINERVSSVGAIDLISKAQGASVTAGVLSLAPADATNGGIVTVEDQIFEGNKTFNKPINATLATPSDLRLKRDIKPLVGGVEILMQLNPVNYEKKSSLASSDYSIKENGFIAQELKNVLPILVNEGKGPDKLLSVNYISIIPILTKAIQEQQKTIEGQQKQIDELKILVEKLINKK